MGIGKILFDLQEGQTVQAAMETDPTEVINFRNTMMVCTLWAGAAFPPVIRWLGCLVSER